LEDDDFFNQESDEIDDIIYDINQSNRSGSYGSNHKSSSKKLKKAFPQDDDFFYENPDEG